MDLLERLEHMLASGRDDLLLRFGLGKGCAEAGRHEEACRHLRAALAFDPKHSAAWKWLGKALLESGSPEDARQAWETGLACAEEKGDQQVVKELRVFLKRLDKMKAGASPAPASPAPGNADADAGGASRSASAAGQGGSASAEPTPSAPPSPQPPPQPSRQAQESSPAARSALAGLLSEAGLPASLDELADLTGRDPVLPSSFSVGAAAQAAVAASALAAVHLAGLRGAAPQRVAVDMVHAALEFRNHFLIEGQQVDIRDKITGLYRCGDGGWVRIHANFAHHRDGALRLLGCPPGPDVTRAQVEQALSSWTAEGFETAAAEAGLVATALRSFAQWDAHPQARAMADQPLIAMERIGDAPPLALPEIGDADMPLSGLRVLDLTRILAGPAGSRALAAYGADVLAINSPHLPNIGAIAEMSRGKLSAHLDLRAPADRAAMQSLLGGAHVMMQGYRPGALAALGFGPDEAARLRPGIVYVSLSAYGHAGPWADRRGFDSLVQTGTGFNWAEAEAAGQVQPRPLPMQILDYASGFLMAFGAQAALARQATDGGSWHVQVSLARTAQWLRGLGRIPDGLDCPMPAVQPLLQTSASGFGSLSAVPHAAQFSLTPAGWSRPSVPPGSDRAVWPFR